MLLNPWGGLSSAQTKPDFVVTSVSDPPASALPGASFTLDVTVKNQGTVANATASLTQISTKFYLVVGTTQKNLKGILMLDLPMAAGEIRSETLTLEVYSDAIPGTYNLQACADGDGDVSEGNENNNCTNAVGIITVQQAPDLIISSISNPPSSGGQGQPITVKDTVKNIGPVDADPTVTKYNLVSTADGSKQDLKLPSPEVPTPLLKSGQTFTEQQIVTIRPETSPGSYRLEACADGKSKSAAEQSEDNNCTTSSGIITVTAVPNLVVTSVTVPGAPPTVEPGDTLAIEAGVTNLGLAQARASTMNFVLTNTANGAQKNLNGTQTIPVLNGQASTTVKKTVTVYSDTPSGTYTVQACADSAKVVAETFESDNCKDSTATVTVQGVTASNADLVVVSVTGPPTTAFPGDPFPVTAVVKNVGTEAAPASTTSFYLVNTSTGVKKNLKGGQNVAPLAPNATVGPTVTISVYSDTLAGTYKMQACADGPKTFTEAVESNNCTDAAGTITVVDVPNLVVSSIGNPPAAAPLGGPIKLTSQVKNLGNVQAGASRTKYFLVPTDGSARKDLKGGTDVPALSKGQAFSILETLTVFEDSTPGTYRAQACADGGNAVKETNEDDNCMTSSGTIHVTGKPDLTIQTVSVKNAPLSVARGGSLTITIDPKNLGEGDAAATTAKFLLVSTAVGGPAPKNLNGTQAVAALRSGAGTTYTKIVTVFNDTAAGEYVVQACADSLDIIDEASELNNCTNSAGKVTVTVP
jgi:subtilase family serine protease